MEQEPSPPTQRNASEDSAADGTQITAASAAATGDPGPVRLDRASPQLTVRAVLTGMVLGAVLSICNVYVGLKMGVCFGMSITAALLGYGFWGGLRGLSGRRIRPWGMLENNINQTASSAAASVASAGLVAPIPALTLLTGQTLEWHFLALWVFSVMLVGVAVAVPLRRQMVVVDRLRFPAGVASAEMLRELHTRGSAALTRVTALACAALVAAAIKLLATFRFVVPYGLPFSIKGLSARSLTMSLNPSLLFVGIGGLIGFRACCSLLLGAILAYGILSPPLIEKNYIRATVRMPLATLPAGVAFPPADGGYAGYNELCHVLEWSGVMTEAERDELLARAADAAYQRAVEALCVHSQSARPGYPDLLKWLLWPGATLAAYQQAVEALYVHSQSARPGYPDLLKWLLWPGATLMVIGSLVSVCFSWRSIVAVLPGRRKRARVGAGAVDSGEVRRRWFVVGLLGALVLSIVLQVSFFGIFWWAATVGVFLTFALATVAARVAGETGLTPVGAMGKVTQLMFGLLVPRNPVPNLMAANVTGGAASQCADLLDDLKCGYLLGASPRLQTLAQLCGALAGALAGSAAYLILIPNPSEMLMTEEWAAPAAATWWAVAKVFMVGFRALPAGVPMAMALAALAGVGLPILERVGPRRLRPLVPSAVSIGLAFVFPAWIAFSMFIGGLVALLLGRWFKNWSVRFVVAICVGLIAGESLTGIGVALQHVLAG